MAEATSNSGAKIGAAAGGGGILVGLMATFGIHSMLFIGIVVGGMVIVAALVLGYILAIKVLDKRRSAAGDAAIEDDSRRRLQKVNDPEQVAKIAELGRQFEEGVKKYRQATGQRLSESSWYVFTGTPGSGKTEAIRHCGIQMPEGLHKEQQGAGGTVNMDWWFTEEGIILDTAGRYLSDNSSSGEWERFLKMLTKARPDCPINGMLIALPADSLQKDTGEEVQQKATEIARFLDRARNTLGVRFPVFVIITKSDLIPGFREFFAHINDPDLQAQIVGWSKPDGLDEPFVPDDVEEYLKTLRNTLLRRRINLMSDPICDKDPDGRRLNEVDSLYLFPDSLMEIAPRLKRYLQGVFVKSKFNQTPLFLRGIYFTSAFEEGAALDSTLARIRGMSLEELEAEGRNWKVERALFLRELFEKKVFKESGLVTRATNTQAMQRNRKMLLLGGGFAAVFLLGIFTWLSYKHLANDIGPESSFWATARESSNYENLKLTDASSAFIGNVKPSPIVGDDEGKRTPVEFFTSMRPGKDLRPVTEAIPVPALFRPMVPVTKTGFNPLRQSTFRLLFDRYVLVPLVKQTREQLKAKAATMDAASWREDSPATLALAELLKIECMNESATPVQGVQLRPFFKFLFPTSNLDDTTAALQKTLDSIYDNSGKPKIGADNDNTMLAKRCGSDMDVVNVSVEACIAKLQDQWFDRDVPAGKMLDSLRKLHDAVVAVNVPAAPPKDEDDYNDKAKLLRDGLNRAEIIAIPNADSILGWHPGDHLVDVFQKNNEAQEAVVVKTWHVLSDAISTSNTSAGSSPDGAAALKKVSDKLKAATQPSSLLTNVIVYNGDLKNAQTVDKGINILVPDPNAGSPAAATVAAPGTVIQASAVEPGESASGQSGMVPAYVLIRSEFKDAVAALPDVKQAKLDGAEGWKETARKLNSEVAALEKIVPTGEVHDTIIRLQGISNRVIEPALKYKQIQEIIGQLPASNDAIKTKLRNGAIPAVTGPRLIMIPDASLALLKEYSPDAALEMLTGVNTIRDEINKDPEPLLKSHLVEQLTDRETALQQYLQDYTKYWKDDVDKACCYPQAASWIDFCSRLKGDAPNAGRINDELLKLRNEQKAALMLPGATALKSLPPSISKTLADASAAKDTACRELEILDKNINANTNSIFNTDCESTLSAWTKLCNDSVADACAKIREMTPAEFRSKFIATTSGHDGAEYWKNLYELAIRLLADNYESTAGTSLQAFKATYYVNYPLVQYDENHPEKVLTPDTAADAIKSLDAFLTNKQDDKAKGAVDSNNLMDVQLDRIYHLHGLREEDRKKFENERKLLKVLTDPNVNCTFTFISHADPIYTALPKSFIQGIHPEPMNQQYVTVCSEAGPNWAGYRMRAGVGGNGANKQLTVPATAHQLFFLFSPNQAVANKTNAQMIYDAPWAVLRMIEDGGGIADPTAKGLTWFVEVPQGPAPNDNNRVLVRIEFSLGNGEEMPDHPWW